MGRYKIDIMPKEIFTMNKNLLKIIITEFREANASFRIKRVYLCVTGRLVAKEVVKERYIIGEKVVGYDNVSECSQLIEWEMEVSGKSPVTFETPEFSIIYCIVVEIENADGAKETYELPVIVSPGEVRKNNREMLKDEI